ncbi:hypothetical protein C8J57DRAFT_1492515 [Mycena rebaudengoi]|nr:hypothetical protein C8J57DRAFT_1492515 [Mycena rebaudengoi]
MSILHAAPSHSPPSAYVASRIPQSTANANRYAASRPLSIAAGPSRSNASITYPQQQRIHGHAGAGGIHEFCRGATRDSSRRAMRATGTMMRAYDRTSPQHDFSTVPNDCEGGRQAAHELFALLLPVLIEPALPDRARALHTDCAPPLRATRPRVLLPLVLALPVLIVLALSYSSYSRSSCPRVVAETTKTEDEGGVVVGMSMLVGRRRCGAPVLAGKEVLSVLSLPVLPLVVRASVVAETTKVERTMDTPVLVYIAVESAGGTSRYAVDPLLASWGTRWREFAPDLIESRLPARTVLSSSSAASTLGKESAGVRLDAGHARSLPGRSLSPEDKYSIARRVHTCPLSPPPPPDPTAPPRSVIPLTPTSAFPVMSFTTPAAPPPPNLVRDRPSVHNPIQSRTLATAPPTPAHPSRSGRGSGGSSTDFGEFAVPIRHAIARDHPVNSRGG